MRGHAAQIDAALAALGVQVADDLSAGGWRRRPLDEYRVATMTRPAQHGVIAVIEIARTSLRWPDEWPVEVEVSLGVGYEPALNLMPMLTLPPRAALIYDAERGRTGSLTVTLTGLDAVEASVRQIVGFANDHSPTTTRDFPDAAAIDARLQHEMGPGLPGADEAGADRDDADGYASDFDTQRRLVLLAAMGRHDEARELLTHYRAGQAAGEIGRAGRRFIRQLIRWLDAGGPVAPPVEETLAQLPRRLRPPQPSWSNARAESSAKKEALDAARARSQGKTLDELRELIANEYSARGIAVAPSVVDVYAEMLRTAQRPFGRARTALQEIRMFLSVGADTVRLVKHASDDDPAWLRPPDRAAYPLIADQRRYTAVQLDVAAHHVLARVRTDAPRRLGPWVLVDVWLAREDPAGPLVVSIGGQRVGTIRDSETREFDQAMRAAALFDEDPFVGVRLTTGDGTGAAILEIPLPERQGGDVGT